MTSLSVFEKLKIASSTGQIKSLRQLTPGSYEVDLFKVLNTKYGKRLIVRVQHMEYFLPHRFAEVIEGPEAINALNSRRYIMVYGGMDALKQNRIKVNFLEAPPQDSEREAEELGMDTIE